MNLVRTSQETQYISVVQSRTLATRPLVLAAVLPLHQYVHFVEPFPSFCLLCIVTRSCTPSVLHTRLSYIPKPSTDVCHCKYDGCMLSSLCSGAQGRVMPAADLVATVSAPHSHILPFHKTFRVRFILDPSDYTKGFHHFPNLTFLS
jgi:hypothetical protein